MSTTEKPRRDAYNTQAEFETAMSAWLLEQTPPSGGSAASKGAELTAKDPTKLTRSVMLVDISDRIQRGSANPFRVLGLLSPDGEAGSIAVNENYFETVKDRLIPGTHYELSIEVRRAGVTTYTNSQGKVVAHTSSGENLTSFRQITEKVFQDAQTKLTPAQTAKMQAIISQDASYAAALAHLLK